MIKLSNGHVLEYVIASGALAFDGKGWPWERPLVALGLIKPELFTIVLKSLTRYPRKGNLRWWHPWTCVRLIRGGAVNKVGLTNGGIEWWCAKVAPTIDFKKFSIIGSIFGETSVLVNMAKILNRFDLKGLEVNVSCPNTGHALAQTQMVIGSVEAVKNVSRHPIIVKVSVDQDYLAIAQGLHGVAEAISLNSVAWNIVYPFWQSPLRRLERKVGGGGGGVSGRPAQFHNGIAVQKLAQQGALPVIGPGVMDFEYMKSLREFGAAAVSFGTIHLPDYPFWRRPWTLFTNPCKPTRFVEKEKMNA